MMPPYPLPDNTVLYRSLTRAETVQGKTPTPKAFMRRAPHPVTGNPRDVAGVSVTLADERSEDQVIAEEVLAWKPRGICRILVSEVKATAPILDVVPDKPTHANITGLPEVPEDPPTTEIGRKAYEEAEFLARELVRRAQMCWTKN